MRAAMSPQLANPSSLHQAGRAARSLLEDCRERLARRLGAAPAEILFTSGGTEANRLAILGALEARENRAAGGACSGAGSLSHAVSAAIEHPSTREVYRELEARGRLAVTWIAAGEDGRVRPAQVEAALRPETFLVSLMHANNETGVLQEVAAVSEICRGRGALLHCDAVQSLGKVPWRLDQLGADLVAMTAHKVNGPRGSGALWVRGGAPFKPPWGGGPQERGGRPGTENLPGIAGFAKAVEGLQFPGAGLRDRLWSRIQESCSNAVLNGAREFLVPNTLNVSFLGVRAEILLIRLDLEGVQASSGSACASGAREPSHVLAAMGLPPERIQSAVRFSLGRGTTAEEVDRAAAIIGRCVAELLNSARF